MSAGSALPPIAQGEARALCMLSVVRCAVWHAFKHLMLPRARRFNEAGAFDPTAGAAGTVYAYLGGGAGLAAGGGGGRGSLFAMDVATGALAPARPFEGGFDTIVSDFAVDKRTGRAYAVLQVGSRARPSV